MSNPTVIVIPAGSTAGPRFATRPSVDEVPTGGRPPRRGIFSGFASSVSGVFTAVGGALLVALAAGIDGSDTGLGRGVAGLVFVIVAVSTLLSATVTAGFASLSYRRNRRTGVLWAVLGTVLGLLGVVGGVAATVSLFA